MEVTIDHKIIYGILALTILLSLLGLGMLGRTVTPVSVAGEARLLRWDDWQLFKAERRYEA